MADELVRNILGRLGYEYDDSNFKKFLKDALVGISRLKELGTAYQAAAKAAQEINNKQLAAESKLLTIESKKLTLESKQLTIANKQKALAAKDQMTASRQLTIASKELRLEQQKLRAEKYEETLKKQKQNADGLAGSLKGVKKSLIAMGVAAAASGLFKIALNSEKAILRIRNFVNDAAFARLQKRFEVLNKESGQMFSSVDFEQSASAVLAIDRNTRRFTKSMEFAIKMAPVLGQSMQGIQEAIARGVVFGDEEALVQLGLITPLALEEMRRRTGLSLSDLRVAERERFIFSRLKLSVRQMNLGKEASDNLGSSWRRFQALVKDASKDLSRTFAPTAARLLNMATTFFRMLAASPFGLIVLRLGGLVAGLATLTIGLGALTKAMIFFRAAMLKANLAALAFFGKFLFYGALLAGLTILSEDLWLSLAGPEDSDTLFKKFKKFLDDMDKKTFEWFKGVSPRWLLQWDQIVQDFKDRMIKDLEALFKGEYNWENDALVVAFKVVLDKLEGYVDSFLNKMTGFKDFVDNIFSLGIDIPEPRKRLPDETLSIWEKFLYSMLPTLNPRRKQAADLMSLLSGGIGTPGFNLTPPGDQLLGRAPAAARIDNSTSLTFGANNFTFPSGLNRAEIIEEGVREYRLEFEKQLIKADIGGQ